MNQKRLFELLGMATLVAGGIFIGLMLRTPQEAVAPFAQPAVAVTAPGSEATAGARSGGAATVPSRRTPIVNTTERVSPSVVTVGAEKRSVIAQPWFDNFFYAPRYRYMEQRRRVPYMGSGFLIDQKLGYILTNYHVIEDSESVFVTFPSGLEIGAEVVDADRFIDVALLKLKLTDETAAKLPPALDFGDVQTLLIGEQVMAIGNPFGNLIEDSRPTVTVGYVSAVNRSFRPDVQNERVYANMIQTDAAINPGNSGGPLIDIDGRVIGMNTFIFSPSGGSTGIGFAIPADRLVNFVEEIRQYGKLRPLLMDFDFRTVRSNQSTAVQIVEVHPGGPAEAAGLRVGDVVLEADGRPVAGRQDFYLLFASKQIGERVRLRTWREGEVSERTYTVREAPARATPPAGPQI